MRAQLALEENYLDLKEDCQNYDKGNLRKAKDIAGRIRSLVKDAPPKKKTRYNTISILQQLGKKDIPFIDSAIPYTENPGFSYFDVNAPFQNSTIFIGGVFMGLVYKRVDGDVNYKTFSFEPLFTRAYIIPELREVAFNDWWEQIIYEDKGNGFKLTRKLLILSEAEKQGFAHFDPNIDPEYEKFLKADSLEMVVNGEKVLFKNSAVKSSIRQIGYEVLLTLENSFKLK